MIKDAGHIKCVLHGAFTAQCSEKKIHLQYNEGKSNYCVSKRQPLVLIGGDGVPSGVLWRVCCRCAAPEHQLLDDLRVERSIHNLVVVNQGDELRSQRRQLRLDGRQAGWHLFKFDLGFRITDEFREELPHPILCAETETRKRKRGKKMRTNPHV